MQKGTNTFLLDATSMSKSNQRKSASCALKTSANATRSVVHRSEENNRVWFLYEEGKKLRKFIEDKWPLYLAEFDMVSNRGRRKGRHYGLRRGMVN
jgi:hypothetical protein